MPWPQITRNKLQNKIVGAGKSIWGEATNCEDRNEELDRNGYLLGKLETTTKLLLCCVLLPREWEKGMLVYII